jgi:alpha-D-xyloside xylohydrolase
MQYHSEYNPSGPSRDRTPWNVAANNDNDERAISVFRHFARIRMNLLPYIAQEADHAARHGTPLMRSLLLDHADDPVCWGIQDQYTFGRSLLVAPVVEEGVSSRTLYLPKGDWVDLWTSELTRGDRWITVDAPLEQVPVFARSGSVLPLRFGAEGRFGDDTGNGTSVIEGLSFWLAGPRGEGTWTDPDGREQRIAFQSGDDARISVDLPPLPVTVRVLATGHETAVVEPSLNRQTALLSRTI